MSTYIADTMNLIDSAIASYAQNVFVNFGSSVSLMLQAMGLVGLAFIAINSLYQVVPIRLSEYLKWSVRYVVIFAVATSWSQFLPFYKIVTDTPSAIGAQLLSVTDAPDLNTALDKMVTGLFDFSETTQKEASLFGISLTAVLIWAVGALLACATIIVTGLGKIGLAMAVSLAPVFIPALMFNATRNLFEGWVKFVLGFALIPVVSAGVMGAIVGIGQGLVSQAGGATTLNQAAGFLIVGLAAVFLMMKVPDMVGGLAGTIVAAANGINEMRQAGGTAQNVGRRATESAAPRVAQAASAVGAARSAIPGGRVAAAMQDIRATQAAMKDGREKIGQKNAERGKFTSRAERREAGRAAMTEAIRSNSGARAKARVGEIRAMGVNDEA